jgi:GH25 family lysozyme M1 (1,4-beta-N-acetylmuramidase)
VVDIGTHRTGVVNATALAVALTFALGTVVAGGSALAADGPGSAGSAGDAAVPLEPAVAAQPPPGSLPGIDVSHHQDAIDWAQVAASGQRFAIAKATEGRNFVDPMYATNKAGAEAMGMAFGAYHFAQPDDGPNDAVREADHFVDVAQLEPGNLLPVLDIERTNGLTQAEITTWILTWLGRVTERVGVRPMVYTSPAGWENRTGDTTAVADAGYTVLWVAHWGVAEPRLPANDWSGHGWTFWQYGNCGSVPGIEGCVDVDWYDSSSFDPVTIPSPDVTPPTATFTPPGDVEEPLEVSFSEVVHQVSPDNVYLWSPRTGSYPSVVLTCRSGRGVEVDCGAGNVREVTVQPSAPLIPGEDYEAVVNPAVVPLAVVDRGGNPVPTTTLPIAPVAEVEQDSAAVTYAWRTVSNRRAFGGAYAFERAEGATASFEFRGKAVTWYTATGPSQGRAAVRIDGEPVGTFDQYAPTQTFKVARTFGGLARGQHTITVRVLGRAASAATDTQVVVDAFEAGGDRVSNPALAASWGTGPGGVRASDVTRASAELTFRGTGVVWITRRGPDQGRAQIFVDGVLVRQVDNYAPGPEPGVERTITGLVDGVHVLRIVVLGEARPAADAARVSIDRFSILP